MSIKTNGEDWPPFLTSSGNPWDAMGGRADYMAAHFVLDFKRVRPEGYLFSKPSGESFRRTIPCPSAPRLTAPTQLLRSRNYEK